MADVYLTKIERKTIFTRSLIYVLVLFLIADLTVTGPFYFNFIPWLFLFSCFISLRGVDKVLTGIIGSFTVLVASLVTNGANVDTLLITANAVVQLVLGMLTSKGIYQFVLEHRLVKYLGIRKRIILAIVLMMFFLTACATQSFMFGDFFKYNKAHKNLTEHIGTTYNSDYKIKNVIYNNKYIGGYAFIVEIDNEEVHFLPNELGMFKDINRQERLKKLNKDISQKTRLAIESATDGMKYVVATSVSYKYEYTKVGIKPDLLVLSIALDTNEKEKVYSELSEIINKLLKLEYTVDKITIILNNTNLHISKENFNIITPEYIEGGFNIEDLDE